MPSLPSTVTTTESFPASTPENRLDLEIQLRLRAGALRATYERQGSQWVMMTEWSVIGGIDPGEPWPRKKK